ncbi:MAG: hypothetical protein K8T10_16190 [Candidatus Eremiobacteraeota bacterium]|nr:hypothetical protein [Candidatus Eremiobacteraeota bacterium]
MKTPHIDDEISAGDAVLEMTKTRGWLIIRDWMRVRISSIIESLLTCPIEEVSIKRAQIKTLKNVLLKVDEIIDGGDN